jgi:hypothetical protein
VTAVLVIDPGLSDHCLLTMHVNLQRPRPDVQTYPFRNIKDVDLDAYAAHIRNSDAWTNLATDVDTFADQLERSVIVALDSMAHFRREPDDVVSAAVRGCWARPLLPSGDNVGSRGFGVVPGLRLIVLPSESRR